MSGCELSPSAYAFSTVLTAFIGSVINGLTSGALIAFMTGWISWIAFLRILVAALIEFWQTYAAGLNMAAAACPIEGESSPMDNDAVKIPQAVEKALGIARFQNSLRRWQRGVKQDVNALGWLGWCWSAIYTPISQTIWVAVNFRSTGSGVVKIVRGIAIGVSALGLTYDNKQRYAASLGARLGVWAFVLFNVWNATACLVLGAQTVVLLVKGLWLVDFPPKWIVAGSYVVFSIMFAVVSIKVLPVINGSRKGVNIFVDVFIGASVGVIVAFPAFGLWQFSNFEAQAPVQLVGGPEDGLSVADLSVTDYLSCETASIWEKFAAIMP